MVDEQEHERELKTEGQEGHGEAIHLPGPSYWPLLLAMFLLIAVGGLLVHPVLTAAGALAALGAVIAWGLEDPNK